MKRPKAIAPLIRSACAARTGPPLEPMHRGAPHGNRSAADTLDWSRLGYHPSVLPPRHGSADADSHALPDRSVRARVA